MKAAIGYALWAAWELFAWIGPHPFNLIATWALVVLYSAVVAYNTLMVCLTGKQGP